VQVERERVTFAGHLPPWIRHEHLARYFFAALRADHKTVVDCACGDGTCAAILASRALSVRGFDLSEPALQRARVSNLAANVTFETGDATALPIADSAADLYVSLETIEHLPDPEPFLADVVRILRPSGTFICSTPDRDVYSPGHALESRPWNRFHIREYTQAEFTALLEGHFACVELYGQNPKPPGLVRIQCAAGRVIPGDLVVRLNQALKLPRYLHDRLEDHALTPVSQGRRYEILTAVCSSPRDSARVVPRGKNA
jgi:SAM-dependent methyltransferase